MGEMGMHFHFGVSHRGRMVANPEIASRKLLVKHQPAKSVNPAARRFGKFRFPQTPNRLF
jgi:hypothetical protein